MSNSNNQNLETIKPWLNVNRNKVNTHKSFYIVFSYRNKIFLPPIRLGTETIAQTERTKFLGITLDSSLSFKMHINEISSKLSRSVGILYKLKSFLPEEILKNLYYSLVHPYINYNIESWFGASQYMIEKVRILQRQSLGAVFNLTYNDHTNSFFKSNFIIKPDNLYKFILSFEMVLPTL